MPPAAGDPELRYVAHVNGRVASMTHFTTPQDAMNACEEILLDEAREVVRVLTA